MQECRGIQRKLTRKQLLWWLALMSHHILMLPGHSLWCHTGLSHFSTLHYTDDAMGLPYP